MKIFKFHLKLRFISRYLSTFKRINRQILLFPGFLNIVIFRLSISNLRLPNTKLSTLSRLVQSAIYTCNSLRIKISELRATAFSSPFRLHFNGSLLPPGLDRPIAPLPRRENWESRATWARALHVGSQAEKKWSAGSIRSSARSQTNYSINSWKKWIFRGGENRHACANAHFIAPLSLYLNMRSHHQISIS